MSKRHLDTIGNKHIQNVYSISQTHKKCILYSINWWNVPISHLTYISGPSILTINATIAMSCGLCRMRIRGIEVTMPFVYAKKESLLHHDLHGDGKARGV
jgi:hypothetical protein